MFFHWKALTGSPVLISCACIESKHQLLSQTDQLSCRNRHIAHSSDLKVIATRLREHPHIMSGAQATWLFTRNDPKVKLSVWKLLSHHHVVASHSPPPWDLLPTVQLNYQLCRNWSSTSPGNYLEGETEKIKVCYFWTYLKCLGQWLNYSENGLVKKRCPGSTWNYSAYLNI